VFQRLGNRVDLVANAPIHRLHLGTCLKIYHAVRKHVEAILADLIGIVPVLKHRLGIEVAPYFIKITDKLVIRLLGLELLGHLWQRGCTEHIEDEHRMMRRQRASTLGDDIGMRDIVAVGDIGKGIHAVVDILLDGIVDRTFRVAGTCAVIVYAQSATTVDILDVVAHLSEIAIVLCGLGESILYAADLRDLAADMEMDESDTVVQADIIELLQRLEQLHGREAELRCVATTLSPFSGPGRGQFDADADVWLHFQSFGRACNDIDFIEFFHHDENVLAQFLCEHGQLDVALILVSIANDE